LRTLLPTVLCVCRMAFENGTQCGFCTPGFVAQMVGRVNCFFYIECSLGAYISLAAVVETSIPELWLRQMKQVILNCRHACALCVRMCVSKMFSPVACFSLDGNPPVIRGWPFSLIKTRFFAENICSRVLSLQYCAFFLKFLRIFEKIFQV
jgi:hypothetical protein